MVASQQKSLSAWGMSVVMHTAIVIALALILQTSPRSLPEQRERPASIVLARRDANDETRYFDAPGDHESDRVGQASLQAALPAEDLAALPPSPNIALPSRVADVGAATASLLPGVTLGGSGRRWQLPDAGAARILAEEASRRQAAGAAGPAASVSLFGGSPSVGRTFVFLIDRSKSMGNPGLGVLEAAGTELVSALARLTESQRFQVIAYNQQCVHLQGKRQLLPASDENKQAIQGFLGELAAFNGTDHYIALQLALALKPDVIYLLTDGGDPPLNASQLRGVQKLAAKRTSVHCVQFGFGPLQESDNFMMRLARENRGGYEYVQVAPR